MTPADRREHRAPEGVPTNRRTFLQAVATAGGAMVLGGVGWWALAEESAPPSRESDAAPRPLRAPGAPLVPDLPAAPLGPYGALARPDRNGLHLPAGFTSRIVARTGRPVGNSGYLWHPAPDGGAGPDLAAGRLEVLCGERGGPLHWEPVPDPAATRRSTRKQVRGALHFDGGEGCVYGQDSVWFTTKGDGKVWRLHAPTWTLSVLYDEGATGAPVSGLDNLARSDGGELFLAEDRGSLDIGLISPNGQATRFAHLAGHRGSEIAGPAFSPDGSRLYFSSQRGTTARESDGYTFEITGPFHHL